MTIFKKGWFWFLLLAVGAVGIYLWTRKKGSLPGQGPSASKPDTSSNRFASSGDQETLDKMWEAASV